MYCILIDSEDIILKTLGLRGSFTFVIIYLGVRFEFSLVWFELI